MMDHLQLLARTEEWNSRGRFLCTIRSLARIEEYNPTSQSICCQLTFDVCIFRVHMSEWRYAKRAISTL